MISGQISGFSPVEKGRVSVRDLYDRSEPILNFDSNSLKSLIRANLEQICLYEWFWSQREIK